MDWSLPAELAAGASVRGEEYGWEIACFPAALATAERLELACLGGQFQFRFDDAVYEMYWLSADPTERLAGEAWTAYVHRSCSEVAKGFDRLVATTDFPLVFRELPSDLRDKATADAVDPTRVLVFVAYFVTERAFVDLSVTKR
jgi:hypothetical protein